METQCPDFELAPLEQFDRRIFMSEKGDPRAQLKSFILSLALIYNDFKGLDWWLTQLEKGKPAAVNVTPYLGQYSGMRGQIYRNVVGLLLSLLQLVEKNSDVIALPEIAELVALFDKRTHELWEQLVSSGLNLERKVSEVPSLSAFLQRIRSKAQAHYDQEQVAVGYKSFFTQSGPFSEFAQVSLGRSLAETRFYFADAAATRLIERALDSHGFHEGVLGEFSLLMNTPVASLVYLFMRAEQERLKTV